MHILICLYFTNIFWQVPHNANYIMNLSAKLQKLACEQLLCLWCSHTVSICKHCGTNQLYFKGCIHWISSPACHKRLSVILVFACLFTSCPKWVEFRLNVSPRNQVIYKLLWSHFGWIGLSVLKSRYLLDRTGKTNQQFAKILSVSGFATWAHVHKHLVKQNITHVHFLVCVGVCCYNNEGFAITFDTTANIVIIICIVLAKIW